jgi:serine beta-lactamase-like protein LACTB
MQENIQPRQDYSHVVEKLEEAIAYEMEDKDLPAISIALVDDQEIVWAQGFGMADPDEGIPATAGTVHRIASLSKLFTDMAVMQLAERGDVDIDAPITDYLPEFQPRNSFDREITLRQIMSHRSGIVREPPVGHYFDPTEPTVAQLVESLNSTDIVYEPESRTKYSNAAISVAGYAVEKVRGQSFDQYMQANILDPIGMSRSSYLPKPEIIEHLAIGYMWGYDGRVFEAPTFELGMVPAAGMYSTAKDLAEFMKMLFNGERRDCSRRSDPSAGNPRKDVGNPICRGRTTIGLWTWFLCRPIGWKAPDRSRRCDVRICHRDRSASRREAGGCHRHYLGCS